jgi:hypothetical protein
MANQETMRRLAAIRRLARQMPLESVDKRLAQIAEVASGKGDVDGVFQSNVQDNLAERIAAAQASRSPMAGDKPPEPKEEPEKERKSLRGRDRAEKGGVNRSE